MNKYMKKIIIALFSFTVLFVGQTVFASTVTWNQASNDCSDLAVANYTDNVGYPSGGNPCWPMTTVNASSGDTINVRIYYHNTSDITGSPTDATHTVIKLNAPTGASTHQQFSASINSDQGSLSTGNAYINLSSSETLTLGSARWYPNQGSSYTTSGTDILNNGVQMGTIASGMEHQGVIVVSFLVGSSTAPSDCHISEFNASPSTINSGDSSSLHWVTDGCSSVSISPSVGSYTNTTGYHTVYPSSNTTYTLTAFGPTGNADDTATTHVYVTNHDSGSDCNILDFSVNDNSIDSGDHTDISWDTEGCDYVNITNIGNSLDTTDNVSVHPTHTTTYTINAYGTDGTHTSDSLQIHVNANSSNSDCNILDFTTNRTSVTSGQSATISWDTENCDYVNISGIGNVNDSGSRTVSPSSTTTYTINAHDNNGNYNDDTVRITVGNAYNGGACAVTTSATGVTSSTANLNGYTSNSDYVGRNTYFEYDTTGNMSSRTVTRNVSGNTAFNEILTGLAPATTYYFRMVSDCSNGVSEGSVGTFRTAVAYTPAPASTSTVVYRNTTSVVRAESPIMLKIENKAGAVSKNDIIEYVVTYKNIGGSTLTDAILKVIMPKGIVMKSASEGKFVNSENTLVVELGTLKPSANGTISIEAQVTSIPSGDVQFVADANLVYTTANNAQESAMASFVNDINKDNNTGLGAAALFGAFGALSLLGWLILLLIIFFIILLVRKFLLKDRRQTDTHVPTPKYE